MKRECETCIKRKTKWCPNSSECYDTSEMIHYQNRIMLLEERDKYKSLYQNEKEKNDTLIRIIKEVKEELKKHLNAKSYGNHKYELFSREYLVEILDLLKEIK